MDGDYLFDAAAEAARALRAEGRIGPAAVVGVGYGAGFGSPGNFRGRDYTPTASPEEPASGGAGRFVDYLASTLWPELARRHRLREDRRAIAGHSLGSLAVLHALFQPRPFFSRALASAPSLWWDNRSFLGLAAALRDRQQELRAMTGDLDLLERQLAARPFDGLEVTSVRFPGHDHYDVVPAAMRAGLATLLG
jgi:predicted alpha/beta superfamily hydrolase